MSAPRFTYANVASTLALLVALTGGGVAVAAGVAKNSVGSQQIKNGQVKRIDLARDSVDSAKVRANALRGTDIKESTLGTVPKANRAAAADNVLAAVVAGDGTLAPAQSRNAQLVVKVGVGRYRVQFNRVITSCAYIGTIGLPGNSGIAGAGTIAVVGSAGADTNKVFVATRDNAAAYADIGFHLAVIC